MSKLKEWLATALEKLPALHIGNVWVTLLAILLLYGTILLYVGTWVYLMFWRAAATLADLKDIIVVLCGAPLIAAVSTLRGGLVDKDNDGIADVDEREVKEHGNTRNIGERNR